MPVTRARGKENTMATAARLVERQNADGGWGYAQGSSWTEPTCLAVLALCAADVGQSRSEAVEKGLAWLGELRNADGGWPPRQGVAESTWVTALVPLLPDRVLKADWRMRALRWLDSSMGVESGLLHRLRLRFLGLRPDPDTQWKGWPWFPGEAAWVTPTAFSILAMERADSSDSAAQSRVEEGRSFLLARRCADGGWNHGGTHALGYEADSYPETTGVALLALHGAEPHRVAGSIAAAQSHLARVRSREAAMWLELGLRAHGIEPRPPQVTLRDSTPDSVIRLALELLVDAARDGRNVLVNHAA